MTTRPQGITLPLNANFVSVKDAPYFAVGDGIEDDTAAIQAAITATASLLGGTLYIPSGIYKTTAQLTIAAPLTIFFGNKATKISKAFNGEVFSVTSGYVTFYNPGIEGNGTVYTGGGIRFGSGTAYDCAIYNPLILNTQDSGVLLTGANSGLGLLIEGGSIIPYNSSGQSSAGPAAIRKTGATDTSTCNRRFIGVTSSSSPLIDLTGFIQTFITNCFGSTILFTANPDVTGATGTSSSKEAMITGTYVRDGMDIAGQDHVIDTCISHGFCPKYSSYGVLTTASTWSWELSANAQNCSIGAANQLSNKIGNFSPNGLGDINNKYWAPDVPFSPVWTGASVNPVIGNGSFAASTYTVSGYTYEYSLQINFGSTTTLGTGVWSFNLPWWTNLNQPMVGTFVLFVSGGTNVVGNAYLSGSGATHKISLIAANGTILGSAYPGAIAAGSQLQINIKGLRN